MSVARSEREEQLREDVPRRYVHEGTQRGEEGAAEAMSRGCECADRW